MRIPGFTAEAALYRRDHGRGRAASERRGRAEAGRVVPQDCGCYRLLDSCHKQCDTETNPRQRRICQSMCSRQYRACNAICRLDSGGPQDSGGGWYGWPYTNPVQ
jgi:hypothetical protein